MVKACLRGASMLPKPVVDYRRFRFRLLNTKEFSHLKLLLIWPVFMLFFQLLEHDYFGNVYTPVEIPLDDYIPFCEWFAIPYVFWFYYLFMTHVYTLFYDVRSFRRMSIFIAVTYLGILIIYIIYPTCQELRPLVPTEPRNNFLTRFMEDYYEYDSNTNVCPSIHVAGSWAVVCGIWYSRHFSTTGWRITFVVVSVLISLSTCFVKQHSALDVITAMPLCALAWAIAYFAVPPRQKSKCRQYADIKG